MPNKEEQATETLGISPVARNGEGVDDWGRGRMVDRMKPSPTETRDKWGRRTETQK